MIHIEHVTRRFGRVPAVEDVSLTIQAGDSLALWGSNGAGKTTLIRCVLGLLACHGSISIGGCDVHRSGKQARMLVGYVPQELGFYDDLGVAESVVFFARLKGIAVCCTSGILDSVGLVGHEQKRIRELSGGMKQRLALAIALLGDPPVLVLDEVTASLDACGREEFVALLATLCGSGRTMLFASHRLDEVATLAKRVAVLDRGSLVGVSSSAEFVARAASGTVLHLMMPAAVRDQAMASLRGAGFLPVLNGVGVLVPVANDQKAAPFRLLAQARITIDDFELVSPGIASVLSHQEMIP